MKKLTSFSHSGKNYLSIYLLLSTILLFSGSCKEHSPEQLDQKNWIVKKTLATNITSFERNLTKVPFHAKIVIKTKNTITRKTELPPEVIAKIKDRLNRKPKNKGGKGTPKTQAGIMTTPTGSSYFSASQTSGNVWSCEAFLDNMPYYYYGIDWYIVDERTGNYSLLTTTNTVQINFEVYDPDYGYYSIFGYQPVSATTSWTNELLLGDPYTGVYPGVAYHNGALEFASLDAFKNMITQLENETEIHNANFFDNPTNINLSDDDINALAESQGFDEYAPLRSFENYFGLYSMRQNVENAELTWMDNTTLDPNTDPEKNCPVDSEIMRTLLNTDGEVKIGSYSYQSSFVSQPSCCKSNDRKFGYGEYDGGNKKAKIVASFHGAHLLLGDQDCC